MQTTPKNRKGISITKEVRMHIAEYVVVIRDVVIVYRFPLNIKHSIPFTHKNPFNASNLAFNSATLQSENKLKNKSVRFANYQP